MVDGKAIEGTFRAHQVPITMEKEEHLAQLGDVAAEATGRKNCSVTITV